MAKYFLGSVGTAEAFRMRGGKLEIAFVSKTLTDSGINIATTKDDLRAGTGAPIVTSFYHDPSVDITLTDIMFKTAYIEAQLGADFYANGQAYQSEQVKADSSTKKASLKKAPVDLALGCNSENKKIVWYAPVGSDEWKILDKNSINDKEITFPAAGDYCVRYLANDEAARVAEIKSDMIPQELYLVITAPLYAGDACSASQGRQAGTIQFEVPRFKLNGAQDFAMNMSSNQTLSLSGSALAVTNDGCDANSSRLLRIIEVVWDRKWNDGVKSLILDPEYLGNGDTVEVYAVYENGTTALVDNSELKFTATGEGNSVTDAGVLTVAATGTISAAYPKTGTAEFTATADLDYSAE